MGDYTFLAEPRKNASKREVIVENVSCMSSSALRCNPESADEFFAPDGYHSTRAGDRPSLGSYVGLLSVNITTASSFYGNYVSVGTVAASVPNSLPFYTE
jgi:hypothetical protein